MIDFEKARRTMVDCQIRPNDVTEYAILEAFGSVPREAFVSQAQKPIAYIDEDLPLLASDASRYLMEPMSMARLVDLAQIRSDDIVLDIGCATGYSSAILSLLCSSVVAIESDENLAARASENCLNLGYDNVAVVHSPLQNGLAAEGPYDAIFVGGAVHETPEQILKQLKDGGRLVVVEGLGNAGQAKVYLNSGGIISSSVAFNCAVKPLPGFERESVFEF